MFHVSAVSALRGSQRPSPKERTLAQDMYECNFTITSNARGTQSPECGFCNLLVKDSCAIPLARRTLTRYTRGLLLLLHFFPTKSKQNPGPSTASARRDLVQPRVPIKTSSWFKHTCKNSKGTPCLTPPVGEGLNMNPLLRNPKTGSASRSPVSKSVAAYRGAAMNETKQTKNYQVGS